MARSLFFVVEIWPVWYLFLAIKALITGLLKTLLV